jgi:hypothetical protein
MSKIVSQIRDLLGINGLRKTPVLEKRSVAIKDNDVIESFRADLDNTFLVSFPRTGSHWLRMLMELYFERPSLVRVFYYPERIDYLTLHTHDLDLDVERSHVIYLYRDPVDTVYSQLQYHQEDVNDRERIGHWADLYGRQLDKWLHQETFTKRKTVLRYEGLKRDIIEEFRKVCKHFDTTLDVERIKVAADRVSKERVKEKTRHDPRVMNLTQTYEEQRRQFHAEHGQFGWQVVFNGREHLRRYF